MSLKDLRKLAWVMVKQLMYTVVGIRNVFKYVIMQLKEYELNEYMIYTRYYYVPKLACNLLSVRTAASKGKSVEFSDEKCWIYNRTGNVCSMGSLLDKLYQLDCEPASRACISSN